MLKNIRNIALVIVSVVSMVSCYDPTQKTDANNTTTSQGREYAPQMYHSEAYDPMSQVTNKDQGMNYFPWIEVGGGQSDYDTVAGHGEFYNSNYYNEHSMNMRTPDENAVSRGELPYRLPKDSIELASRLKPAVDENGNVYIALVGDSAAKTATFDLDECEELYLRFCSHCHGKNGMADGKVAPKFMGVPM